MVVHKTIVATNGICNAFNKTGTLGKLKSTSMGIRVILSQGNLTRKMVVDIMHYISEGSVSHINGVWPSFLYFTAS